MGFGSGSGGRVRARAKKDRKYIPAMPMPLAVLCCIFNFVVPGVGTIIAGLAVCCCARNEDMSCCEKFGSSILSVILGLLQIILTPILFVGWFWSCFWGISFIGMSKEYYHDNKPFDDEPQRPITHKPGPNINHPNQWTSPQGTGGPYGVLPGPSHGYPPGGQGYPPGCQNGGHNPHREHHHNQVMPSAPPQEPAYPNAPPDYTDPPPPYDFKDPLPQKF